jgi:hypothetical protein
MHIFQNAKPLSSVARQTCVLYILAFTRRRCDGCQAVETFLWRSFNSGLRGCRSFCRTSCRPPFSRILHPHILIQAIKLFRSSPSNPHRATSDDNLALSRFRRRLRVLPLDIVDVCAMRPVGTYDRSELSVLRKVSSDLVFGKVVLNASYEQRCNVWI